MAILRLVGVYLRGMLFGVECERQFVAFVQDAVVVSRQCAVVRRLQRPRASPARACASDVDEADAAASPASPYLGRRGLCNSHKRGVKPKCGGVSDARQDLFAFALAAVALSERAPDLSHQILRLVSVNARRAHQELHCRRLSVAPYSRGFGTAHRVSRVAHLRPALGYIVPVEAGQIGRFHGAALRH